MQPGQQAVARDHPPWQVCRAWATSATPRAQRSCWPACRCSRGSTTPSMPRPCWLRSRLSSTSRPSPYWPWRRSARTGWVGGWAGQVGGVVRVAGTQPAWGRRRVLRPAPAALRTCESACPATVRAAAAAVPADVPAAGVARVPAQRAAGGGAGGAAVPRAARRLHLVPGRHRGVQRRQHRHRAPAALPVLHTRRQLRPEHGALVAGGWVGLRQQGPRSTSHTHQSGS